ncbi:uncharacterized protein LOC141653159 [Silene latifolia]|uniref:uncharacterized protein LOC141653159 n=1 Tax=Silene latifolia TaxID=37657 RepID=UPI003D786FE4
MISDSIINVSIPNAPKDFGKKKRANRSAKLKQCKLDARREQWLSQVRNKGPKEKGSGNGELNGPMIETRKGKGKGKEPCCEGVEVRNVSVEVVHNHDSDSEESSVVNSPTSSVNNSGNNYAGSSGNSTSSSSSSRGNLSFGSGGYCSSSTTEEEEGGGDEFGGDDGCLDDWEAVADALVGPKANDKWGNDADHCLDEETKSILDPDSEKVRIFSSGGLNSKAWRSDDAFRPQNLPNLSKQRSFPAKSESLYCHSSNPWGCKMPPPVPTSCPICCEDLDLTDSSFLPCPCGFRLCLFCHKRILEEDARCPGCRKTYTSEVAEKETVSVGSLTTRLARSCSMFSKV